MRRRDLHETRKTAHNRAKELPDDACFLYIISEGENGPCKIGIANEPIKRLSQLQVGNPRKLCIVRQYEVESREEAEEAEHTLHIVLRKLNMSGEWFDVPEDRAIEVANVCLGPRKRLADKIVNDPALKAHFTPDMVTYCENLLAQPGLI